MITIEEFKAKFNSVPRSPKYIMLSDSCMMFVDDYSIDADVGLFFLREGLPVGQADLESIKDVKG